MAHRVPGTIQCFVLLKIKQEVGPMLTPEEYRQQANDCLELAREARKVYTQTALIEMAADFKEIADKLEDELNIALAQSA